MGGSRRALHKNHWLISSELATGASWRAEEHGDMTRQQQDNKCSMWFRPQTCEWGKNRSFGQPLSLYWYSLGRHIKSLQISVDCEDDGATQHRRSMIFVRLCRDIAGCKHCWTPRDIYVGICWTNSGSRWWSECDINIGRVVISILVNFVTSSLVKVGGSLRWSSWDIYVGRSGDFYFGHN